MLGKLFQKFCRFNGPLPDFTLRSSVAITRVGLDVTLHKAKLLVNTVSSRLSKWVTHHFLLSFYAFDDCVSDFGTKFDGWQRVTKVLY